MTDHTALIERTRPHRFAPGTNPAAKARKCDWCARPSLRGETWCPRHAPGYAKDRRSAGSRKGGISAAEYVRVARDEYVTELLIPTALKAWEPIARIIATRPRAKRPVMLGDVVRAMIARTTGDHAPWCEVVANMRAVGIMRDSDRDILQWHA